MIDYNDLIYDNYRKYHKAAGRKYKIPVWADDFFHVEYKWTKFSESEMVDPEYIPGLEEIEKEIYYAHSGRKCYRIERLVVHEPIWIVRTGTVKAILRINQQALRDAEKRAKLLFLRSLNNELGKYADPSFKIGADLIDLGLVLKGFKTMGLPGILAGAKSLSELLSNAEEIAEATRKLLDETNRLRKLDGTVIRIYRNVSWHRGGKGYRTTVIDESITEVECTREILALPEGQIKLFDKEQIYPNDTFDLDREFEKLLEELEKGITSDKSGESTDPNKPLIIKGNTVKKAKNLINKYRKLQYDKK